MWYCLFVVTFIGSPGWTMMESKHKCYLTNEIFAEVSEVCCTSVWNCAAHLSGNVLHSSMELCCTSVWKYAAQLYRSVLHICVKVCCTSAQPFSFTTDGEEKFTNCRNHSELGMGITMSFSAWDFFFLNGEFLWGICFCHFDKMF